MRRFIYQPEVKAFIYLTNANKTIDISNDIISGSVTRKLDGVSTATIRLQNKFGKYTGGYKDRPGWSKSGVYIRPMDPIRIFMQRVPPLFPIFTGYIDDSALFQLYPDSIQIEASCTLKLLQYTFFDPGLPYMTQWLSQFGYVYDFSTGLIRDKGGHLGNFDLNGGIGHVIYRTLKDIGRWEDQSIHIKAMPPDLIKKIAEISSTDITDVDAILQMNKARFESLFGISDNNSLTSGGGTGASGSNDSCHGKLPPTITDKVKLNNAITQWIRGRQSSSPLLGLDFVGLGLANNINPMWGAAFAQEESSLGTSLCQNTPDTFNAWGNLDGNHKCIHYSSWSEGLNAFFDNLNTNSAYKGKNTVEEVVPVYAPSNENNTAKYISDVNSSINEMISMAGTALTCQTQGPAGDSTDPTETNRGSAGGAGDNSKDQTALRNAIAQTAIDQVGKPYVWDAAGPNSFDCSGLLVFAYSQHNIQGIPHSSQSMYSQFPLVNAPDVGDPVYTNFGSEGGTGPGHVGMYIGNNQIVSAPHTGATVNIVNINNFATPQGSKLQYGTFLNPTNVNQGTIGVTGGTSGGGNPTTSNIAAIAQRTGAFQLQLENVDSTLSSLLTGKRALQNDIPLITWINDLTQAAGRSYCSGPNGGFYAFFPDYFGWFGSAPYFKITDIETLNLTINISDQNLVSHVYGVGPIIGFDHIDFMDQVGSTVASVQENAFSKFTHADDSIFELIDPEAYKNGKFNPQAFLAKYGARPFLQDFANIRHPVLLWMATWREFLLKFAQRFETQAEFTFLPELFPGGLVNIHDTVQMFINEVTHNFDMQSGFTTQAELIGTTFIGQKTATDQVNKKKTDNTDTRRGVKT